MGHSKGDKIFEAANNVMLIFVLMIVIYPLIYVMSASISNPEIILKGELWFLPKEITFSSYAKVFQNQDILTGYLNTILYTVVGTAINLILTIMAAYPMSRKDFYGRNVIMTFVVITLFFSGGLIPMYLLVRDLGMFNTIWALVIPGAVSVWNIVIMRTFFQLSIPLEIQEASSIDGCSNLKILWKIVLPLSMPIIAVMILFYSVNHWNAFFNAMIYLTERDKYPLQLFLREILINEEMSEMTQMVDESLINHIMQMEGLKYAVVIVANLPVLILYPFLQKYFVKGVLIGALKG